MPLQKARANATLDQNAPAEKLTGQSRTRSLVATAEQTFDYSDGDWVKIERAIESVRQTPLTAQERRDLQNAADNYRRRVADRTIGNYRSPLQGMAAWNKAGELCQKLRLAIEVAAKSKNREHWEGIPVSVISKELAAKIGRVIRPNIQEELTFKNALRTLDCGDFRDLLIEVETFLRKVGADRLSWRTSEWKSKSGRNEPSVIFYQRILFLWTECFGGKLKYSRHARTNKIGGPLVRYFLTVTEPVMGDKAPSAESIPDILKRQKEFRDWYLAPEREFELEAAKQGWASGTLILSS
jgi:hypothetical protein